MEYDITGYKENNKNSNMSEVIVCELYNYVIKETVI